MGLLPRDNDDQIPFAYNLYKSTAEKEEELAAGFKRTFCTPVHIDFLGVWSVIRYLRYHRALTERLQEHCLEHRANLRS